MKPRGLGWNVHRGQLLCINKRSRQTRKLHGVLQPRPGPPAQQGGRRSVPAGRPSPRGRGGREGVGGGGGYKSDTGREGKLLPRTPPPPPSRCIWNTVCRAGSGMSGITRISTQTSHIAHLELRPRATAASESGPRGPGRRFAKMRFPDARRCWSEAAVELWEMQFSVLLFLFSSH